MMLPLLLTPTWITLALITIQDYKDRSVYWFLYGLVGLLVFGIQLIQNPIYSALFNSLSNLIFISILLLFAALYSKIRFKKRLINESLGLGDILFFIAISFAFAPISFLILFVFSFLFSLVLHLFLNHKKKATTVPLAGHMALFFGIVYAVLFFTKDYSVYAY